MVAKLREAGAIIMGKANLAEFADDGHFCSSASGPGVERVRSVEVARSARSGGSAVAVASSFAAAALGTQTGDSLWGPSSAASLVSLRGTDGMQSTDGVMPLTYVQDYAGVISRTLPDLALLLNATDDRRAGRPARRRRQRAPPGRLDAGAEGRRAAGQGHRRARVGVQRPVRRRPARATRCARSSRTSSRRARRSRRSPTRRAGRPRRRATRATRAGASGSSPTPDNPYTDVASILRSPLRLPQFRNTTPVHRHGRDDARAGRGLPGRARALPRGSSAAWMDAQGVDAVVFPGQLVDIHLNDSIQPSFGRRDPQASAAGVPTVIFPAGRQRPRPADQPAAAGQGVRRPQAARLRLRVRGQGERARDAVDCAPVLPFATSHRRHGRRHRCPATLSLTLGAPASFGAFTPGVAKDYTASTTRERDLAPRATRR